MIICWCEWQSREGKRESWRKREGETCKSPIPELRRHDPSVHWKDWSFLEVWHFTHIVIWERMLYVGAGRGRWVDVMIRACGIPFWFLHVSQWSKIVSSQEEGRENRRGLRREEKVQSNHLEQRYSQCSPLSLQETQMRNSFCIKIKE